MAVTYKIGGLNIIAINEIAPKELHKLSEAMRHARQLVKKATETTVVALHVVRSARETGFDAEEAVSLLETRFSLEKKAILALQGKETERLT